MPYLERKDEPRLYYQLDDFTDPWRHAPVILLQHGFGRSSRFWYSWVPYLSRFYKVVRPDLRGLGESSLDFDLDRHLTTDACIEDLLAILDAIGADSVHYCGESLGGIIGVIFAAKHPDRIRTLNLISTPLYINDNTRKIFALGQSSWQEALNQLGVKGWVEGTNSVTRFPPETDPGLVRWYTEEASRSRVEVLVALSRLASQIDVSSFLSRIQAPVLGLYPSSGIITSQEQEDLLRSRIPNIKIVHLASRYHKILHLSPASCANQVLHFVSQHDGISCHE